MTISEFTAVLAVASFFAGFLGALTGLGGGLILIPVMVLGFGVDIHHAAGASLISVISTSSSATISYLRARLCNIRIGMFLEVATTIGALLGAFLASRLPGSIIAIIFGAVLLHSSYMSLKKQDEKIVDGKQDRLAAFLKMNDDYPGPAGDVKYSVRNVPAGFVIMLVAGGLSGLLGIGSGVVKVIAMDRAMALPFKVSTTTSTFMIGVTAAASAGVYFRQGYIDPALAMPVMLGVLLGSAWGARMLAKTEARKLRLIFAVVVFLFAVQMVYKGIRGGI